jgi:hypothetical protein
VRCLPSFACSCRWSCRRCGKTACSPDPSSCRAYEDELAKANALDFDDLLLRGHELLKGHPRVVAKIQNVLIDEVRLPASALLPPSFPFFLSQTDNVCFCSSRTRTPSSTTLSSLWLERPARSLSSETRIKAVRSPTSSFHPVSLPTLPASAFVFLSAVSPRGTLTSTTPQSTVGVTLRSRTWRRCLKVRPFPPLQVVPPRNRRLLHLPIQLITLSSPPSTDFKPVKQVFLEQNYRSTGAILGAALAVVRQGVLSLLTLPLLSPT